MFSGGVEVEHWRKWANFTSISNSAANTKSDFVDKNSCRSFISMKGAG